jgi:hypothetical protein
LERPESAAAGIWAAGAAGVRTEPAAAGLRSAARLRSAGATSSGIRAGRAAPRIWSAARIRPARIRPAGTAARVWPAARLCAGSSSSALLDAAGTGHHPGRDFDPGAQGGEPIQFTVIQDVTFNGVLAIPRGATVHGVIADVKRSEKGSLTGSNELALELTSLDLMGRNYPLQSDMFRVKGPGKGGRSAGNVVGGALIGAIIGGAIGGGGGAAVGAVAGGGTGAAASAASSGPGVWIPAEALVSFHLATPITIEPVSQQEAMRLAQGLNPGGPTLYRRGPRAYPYRPYPYVYAPVYYRPYYFTGGYYYWR